MHEEALLSGLGVGAAGQQHADNGGHAERPASR